MKKDDADQCRTDPKDGYDTPHSPAFDEILGLLEQVFLEHGRAVQDIRPLLINRDLNGRIRLILDETWEENNQARAALNDFAKKIVETLGSHAFPPEQAFLFEQGFMETLKQEITFPLNGVERVFVVDRLATEGHWSSIQPPTEGCPRIVFYSIKGGVGRSTALAVTAWDLAEKGKRVLVLDLDLESPGLSSSLMPENLRPDYGIADWLVEDLVDNGPAVFDNMVARSSLSQHGDIFVVPAHGADAGEYVVKLGRVWMPKVGLNQKRESWSQRLSRLLDTLEKRYSPDVVLIDSRAGIDEVASACLTDLSASMILLFALNGEQTWSGYSILFRHWHTYCKVDQIRERLQVIAAMVPELEAIDFLENLREQAWDTFSDNLYDEIPAGTKETENDAWSFDPFDENAPHSPWSIRWHRGFAALKSLHGRLATVSLEEVQFIFGPLLDGITVMIGNTHERSEITPQ